jgi:hypothetical protein
LIGAGLVQLIGFIGPFAAFGNYHLFMNKRFPNIAAIFSLFALAQDFMIKWKKEDKK